MNFVGLCPRCREAQKWDGKTVDDRPRCKCGFLADGGRIDKADAKIEGARASGEQATPPMFTDNSKLST